MARTLRTDPRHIRSARRAAFPIVRVRRAAAGRHHPASASDVRAALKIFGDEIYYGVKIVELMPAPTARGRLPLGRLIGPGHIVIYDQARSPWRLGSSLSAERRERLRIAGAAVDAQGVVTWPGDTLKRFMLGHVLAHELGHHVLQHERRLRGTRAARTRDHEARAEAIAERLRTLLP